MGTVSPLDDAGPRAVGPYQLVGRLGDSRTGSVFLASGPDGKLVAVRIARTELAGEPEFRARFHHEANAARHVSSPAVAAVLDADADGPLAYVVSEYADGPTLAEHVRNRGPIPPADLKGLAVALATGLAAVHAAGIMHRDLHPDNVVLSSNGPRIVGVGAFSTPRGDAVTPVFSAPEQVLGEAVTPATDVYAWGGVLLYAGTGRLPHGDGNHSSVVHRSLYQQPNLAGLPQALVPIIARALAKQPSDRPTADQLAAFVSGSVPAPTPAAAAAAAAQTPAASQAPAAATQAAAKAKAKASPARTPSRASRRPPRVWWRRPKIVTPAVFVVTALAVGVVVVATSGDSADPAVIAVTSTDTTQAPGDGGPSPSGPPLPVAVPAPLGVPLAGHTDSVNSAAWSADGTLLAAGSDDTTVILWDVTDPAAPRQLGQPLTGHDNAVLSVALSPDGTVLAAADSDSSVVLWDLADRAAPVQVDAPVYGTTVAFSPNGATLATGGYDTTAVLWDVTDPSVPAQLGHSLDGHSDDVNSVAFSPDGTTLATASSDGTAVLWDVAVLTSPRQLGQPLARHTGALRTVAFSPDGNTLATGGSDASVTLWDVSDPVAARAIGQPLTTVQNTPVYGVAFAPDGARLAAATANTFQQWDVTVPAAPRPLGVPEPSHQATVNWVEFRPGDDGATLATASGDSTVQFWDLDR